MNGRAYDYNLGRFLSVDPFIQFPENSQNLNPYSYIMNNPMSGTDPTGYRISGVRGSGIGSRFTTSLCITGLGCIGAGGGGQANQDNGAQNSQLSPFIANGVGVAISSIGNPAGIGFDDENDDGGSGRSGEPSGLARLLQRILGRESAAGNAALDAIDYAEESIPSSGEEAVSGFVNGLLSSGVGALNDTTGQFRDADGSRLIAEIEGPTIEGGERLTAAAGATIGLFLRRGKGAGAFLRTRYPENDGQIKHMFRAADGHVPDTPANRALFLDLADDPDSYLMHDQWGNVVSARILQDGRQAWVQVRNGIIQNAGINNTPRHVHPLRGLVQP